MNSSLNKLRKKYIITASIIVFIVIMLMIFILNLLMRISGRNKINMLESVIRQAAVTHINKTDTEFFNLSDTEKTDDGNCIIPRNVRDISSITVHGSISCADKTAIWYSAGGGLLFEADTDGERKMVYKDYSFSKDTTNVSISFDDFENIKCGYETLSIDESQITSDYFYVSRIWWQNSSSKPDNDEGVTLNIDSIEIHYRDSHTFSALPNKSISHINFTDVFENDIPQILHNTGAFYFITDKENRLITVNDGNLINALKNDEAIDFMDRAVRSGGDTGKLKKDDVVYSYSISETDEMNIIIFINESFQSNADFDLLWVSITVGLAIWLILFILIFNVSGYVIKPVAESMELQKKFISNASHELKTPITVISTTIDIISSKKGSDCWTECIKQQANKMHTLVAELLELSRMLEVHSARDKFKVCDISNTVSNSLLYFESLFFESGKTLKQDIKENISLNCDENKISQLIGILVDNALKYSDEKSEIAFSLTDTKDNVVIKCSNLCSEFTVEDTSRLFERFYRSDNDRIHEQEGFGLGLSIAQAVTELHGGNISASYQDKIITFTVTLPL